MNNLTQKRLFEERKFGILEDAIKCEITSFFRKRVYHIPLNILPKYTEEKWTSPVLLCFIAFFCWYLTLKMIFFDFSKLDFWFVVLSLISVLLTIQLYRQSYKKIYFDIRHYELRFILNSVNRSLKLGQKQDLKVGHFS